MKAEVVSKDVGVWENGAKFWVTREYSPTCPMVKLQSMCLWVGGSCWGKGIEFKLVDKAWAYKKNFHVNFPNRLLKNIWIESAFPYALSPQHEKAKQNTIGVVRGVNAKLPHCTGHALVYSMENKMSHVYHSIKMVGIWLYIRTWQKLKWKDSKTSNVETRVQIYANRVGIREGIESRWSQGFGLDESNVWQEHWW
jgi:hypothetical protein